MGICSPVAVTSQPAWCPLPIVSPESRAALRISDVGEAAPRASAGTARLWGPPSVHGPPAWAGRGIAPQLREQQPWGARLMPLFCPVGHGQASLFPGPARVVVLGVPRKRTKSSPASCGLWAPCLPGTWLPLRWGWAARSTRLGPEDSLHSPQVEAPGRPGLGP